MWSVPGICAMAQTYRDLELRQGEPIQTNRHYLEAWDHRGLFGLTRLLWEGSLKALDLLQPQPRVFYGRADRPLVWPS